jgi:RHS repeat-associated protein
MDVGLQQQYNRARYYLSADGRFAVMDQLIGRTDSPVSFHKYLYAWADPTIHDDPSGLDPQDPKELGKSAEIIIDAYYLLDHLGDLLDFNIKPWSGYGGVLRIDIINYSHGWLAEIKSLGQADLGPKQLADYIKPANLAKVVGREDWGPDPWKVPAYTRFFWLGAINAEQKDWFGYILGNDQGVISYQLWKRGQNPPRAVPSPVPTEVEIEKQSLEAKRVFDNKQNPGTSWGSLALQSLYVGTQLTTALILVAMAGRAIKVETEIYSAIETIL